MAIKLTPVRHRTRPSKFAVVREGAEPTSMSVTAGRSPMRLEASSQAIQTRPIASLKPYDRNARTHSKRQLRKLAESIRTFGFVVPIVIDQTGEIIAGHGRLEAAKLLRYETVPTIQVNHLTDEMKRAFRLADNQLAALADWDADLLAIELQELTSLDLDFDVEVTGFETAEIDLLIEGLEIDEDSEAVDPFPIVPEADTLVSEVGDLWCLGEHRLLCGNALEVSSFERLMARERAQLVFTDPPYNVEIVGNVCGKGQIQHGDFVMATGEMSESEFTAFLSTVLSHMATRSADGSIHFVCMDWRHQFELLSAARPIYSELKNLCVWAKTNAGMGSLYRSQHELIFAFKVGQAPHINNIRLGQYGRNRSNVWTYAGVNSFGADRLDELAMHPTVKPVALVADAIRDCSKRDGIVLDPFVGSGTTIIAAEKTGRRAFAMELDPRYVDVAIRRWQALTGDVARHAETGQTFDELAVARADNGSDAASPRKTEAGDVA